MYMRALGKYVIYVVLSVWEFSLQENNVLTTFADFPIIARYRKIWTLNTFV